MTVCEEWMSAVSHVKKEINKCMQVHGAKQLIFLLFKLN